MDTDFPSAIEALIGRIVAQWRYMDSDLSVLVEVLLGLILMVVAYVWRNTWGRIGGAIRLTAIAKIPPSVLLAAIPFGLICLAGAVVTSFDVPVISAVFVILAIVGFALPPAWLFCILHGDLDY
jgi:hypothetical protein